jgi:pimeloyl-ACP methyl ester carboxylesterase
LTVSNAGIRWRQVPLEGRPETIRLVSPELDAGHAPLVFVHGGPGFPNSYLARRMAALFPDRPLVFWDQPGAGASVPEVLPFPALGERLVALVTWSEREFDRSVHLVAESFGSLLALGVMGALIPHLEAYTAVSQVCCLPHSEHLSVLQATRSDAPGSERDKRRLIQSWEGYQEDPGMALDYLRASRRLLQAQGRFARRGSTFPLAILRQWAAYGWRPDLWWRWTRGLRSSLETLWPHAYGLDYRTFSAWNGLRRSFLFGDHDGVILPESVPDSFWADGGRQILVPGAGHLLLHEHPEPLVAAIRWKA